MEKISKEFADETWQKFIGDKNVEIASESLLTLAREQAHIVGYFQAAGEDLFENKDDRTYLTLIAAMVYRIFREKFGPLPMVHAEQISEMDIHMRHFSYLVQEETPSGVRLAMDNLMANFNQAGILESTFRTLDDINTSLKMFGRGFESMPRFIHFLMVVIKVLDGEST
ncbi:MAG: hypothetical protein H6581_12495 [Bacteroidia bacterium]|nr:hypothetical protein [Bacteroidia bacterium]